MDTLIRVLLTLGVGCALLAIAMLGYATYNDGVTQRECRQLCSP